MAVAVLRFMFASLSILAPKGYPPISDKRKIERDWRCNLKIFNESSAPDFKIKRTQKVNGKRDGIITLPHKIRPCAAALMQILGL